MKITNTIRSFSIPFIIAILTMKGVAEPANVVSERNNNATQIAKAWFTSLTEGETAVTTSLSSIPFDLDGKKVVATIPELKKIYQQVIEKKGKRSVKITSVKVESSTPDKVVLVLTIKDDDEAIRVFVKPSEAFKVVGFKD